MAGEKTVFGRTFLFATLILLSAASAAHAAGEICSSEAFDSTLVIAGIAALATAAVIGFCYMFGEFFQNARMLTWAKTEIFQVFISLVLAGAVLGLVGSFCSFKIEDIGGAFTGMPAVYKDYPQDSIYNASSLYLENLMEVSHSNMRSLRFALGAYEIRTSFREMECDAHCWVALVSTDTSPYSGESAMIAATNNLLGTATVAYFTASFQYFTLQYIYQGLLLVFLPLAIVMRSVPFMRHFGGSLIAIFLSLYILYPLLLIANSTITPGLSGGAPASIYIDPCGGTDVFRYENDPAGGMACVGADANGNAYREEELHGSVSAFLLPSEIPSAPPVEEQARTSALIFVATVFLAGLDWIIIIAMVRGVSHLLGDEVDASKLGQMI